MEKEIQATKEIPVFFKRNSNINYNLATFDASLQKDQIVNRNIIEEQTQEDVQRILDQKQLQQQQNVQFYDDRKIEKIKYKIFEQKQEDKAPFKYYGFEDTQYQQDSDGIPNYAFLVYDQINNAFNIIPIIKHIKFEKQIEKKAVKQTVEEQKEELKRKAKNITKIQQSRMAIEKILKEQKLNHLNQNFKNQLVQDDNQNNTKIQIKKRKKKQLDEKDLDFEVYFSNDEGEDYDQDQSNSDGELSEDGQEIQENLLKENDEELANQTTQNQEQNNQSEINVNINLEQQENDEENKDEEEVLDEDDNSSLASIFGDEEEEINNEEEEEEQSRKIGQKQGSQQQLSKLEQEKKRQKK